MFVNRNNKRRAAITAALVFATMGVGVAVAAWTSTGLGFGTAKATTAVNLTVNASTGTADLYPGTTTGDLYFTITNPNNYPVTFTGATFGAVTSLTDPACPSSDVTVDASATGLNLVAAAASTTGQLVIADVVNMPGADNDCQGAEFNIAVTLNGASS